MRHALVFSLLAFVTAACESRSAAQLPTYIVRVEEKGYERSRLPTEEGKPVRAKLSVRNRHSNGVLLISGKTNMRPGAFIDFTLTEKNSRKVALDERIKIRDNGTFMSNKLPVGSGAYLLVASVEIGQLEVKKPLPGIKDINYPGTSFYCGPITYKKKKARRVINDLREGGTLGGRIVSGDVVQTVMIAHPPSGDLVERDKDKVLTRVVFRKDMEIK